jgi:hypothetical protein
MLGLYLGLGLGSGGGGAGLSAPWLAPITANLTSYPLQLRLHGGALFESGDVIEFRLTSDRAGATPRIANILYTINDTDLGDNIADIDVSSITSGQTFISDRVQGKSAWSQPILHGTAAAPALTSSATITTSEGVYSVQHTFDKAATFDIQGRDGYDMVASGGQFSTTVTVTRRDGLALVHNNAAQFMLGFLNSLSYVIVATGDNGAISKTTISDTIQPTDQTPDDFAAADLVDQPFSTVVYDPPIGQDRRPITGLGAGVTVNIARTAGTGEYTLDDVTWHTAAQPVNNTNSQRRRNTTPAANALVATQDLTIGTVTDTWRLSTPFIWPSFTGNGLLLEADDLATLFQLIDGTTAVAADNDVVGMWQDQSGFARHMPALANNATRPLWRAGGGSPYVSFDGVDDVLQGTFAMMKAAGSCTIVSCIRGTYVSGRHVLSEGASTSTNPGFHMMKMGSSTGYLTAGARDDNGANTVADVTLATGVWNDAWHVITEHWNGTTITPRKDGVAGSAVGFAPAGPYALLNRLALGAASRATPTSFADIDVACLAIYPGVLLDGAQTQQAEACAAAKQGVVLP